MTKHAPRNTPAKTPAVAHIDRYIEEAQRPSPRPSILTASVQALSTMAAATPPAIVAAVRRARDPERTTLVNLVQALASERVLAALQESSSHPGVQEVLHRVGVTPLDLPTLVAQVLETGRLPAPCPREVALGVLRKLAAQGGTQVHPLVPDLAAWDDAEVCAAANRILERHRLPPPPPPLGDPKGYMSCPVHDGKRRFLMARSGPNGVRVVGPACSDTEGIVEVGDIVVSHREWQRWQAEQALVEFPVAYIRQRIESAYQTSLEHNARASLQLSKLAEVLGPLPDTVLSHPAYDVISAQDLTPDLLAASSDLFLEAEVHHFTFEDEWFFQAAQKVLIPQFEAGQRHFDMALVARDVVPEVESVMRPLLQLRLQDLAYVLATTGRPKPACMALAVAVALGPEGIHPSSDIPFVAALCETTLGMMLEEPDGPQDDGHFCTGHHHHHHP